MRREKGVCFAFPQRERNGFLAKRTPDLLERIQVPGVCVLDEIYVGEATLQVLVRSNGLSLSQAPDGEEAYLP